MKKNQTVQGTFSKLFGKKHNAPATSLYATNPPWIFTQEAPEERTRRLGKCARERGGRWAGGGARPPREALGALPRRRVSGRSARLAGRERKEHVGACELAGRELVAGEAAPQRGVSGKGPWGDRGARKEETVPTARSEAFATTASDPGPSSEVFLFPTRRKLCLRYCCQKDLLGFAVAPSSPAVLLSSSS